MKKFLKKLSPPNEVGTSEYRAIYELLEGAESKGQALAILEEFASWVETITTTIKAS